MTREWVLHSGTSRKGGILGGLSSLLLVAMGLFLLVGLIQSRFALGGPSPLSDIGGLAGFFQGGFGWISSFYFSLLLLIWGGFSFVNGELSDPLKRILASVCFMFFFAGLVASLGGDGGSVGGGASASMAVLIGKVPSGAFFAVLALLGLFLATNWFFYKGFKRFLLPGGLESAAEMGLVKEEEALLLGGRGEQPNQSPDPRSPQADRKREATRGLRQSTPEHGVGAGISVEIPSSIPSAGGGKPQEAPKPQAQGDQDLDRVLEQARSDLAEEREELFVFQEDLELEATDVEEVLPDGGAGDPDEDLFVTLENETLLEAAGKALDKILEEEAPRFRQTTIDEMKEVVLEPKPRAGAASDERTSAPRGEEGVESRGSEKSGEKDGRRKAGPVGTFAEPARRGGSEEPRIEIYKGAGVAAAKEKDRDQGLLFPENPPSLETIHRAAQILLTSRRPLPSLLQRRMGISLAESREIFSRLRKLGAIAEPEGRGPWEPLMTLPEWEEVMRRESAQERNLG